LDAVNFVEVSIDYFVSCGTKRVRVMHKQTKIPDNAETFLEDGGGDTDIRYQPM
jgi:hypothetical protein